MFCRKIGAFSFVTSIMPENRFQFQIMHLIYE